MFKVYVSKFIWDGDDIETSKAHVLVARELSLPFPPFVGLQLSLKAEGMFWITDPLLTVRWDMPDERFVCAVKDDFPHEIGPDDYSFDWLVSNALESGWTMVSKKSH